MLRFSGRSNSMTGVLSGSSTMAHGFLSPGAERHGRRDVGRRFSLSSELLEVLRFSGRMNLTLSVVDTLVQRFGGFVVVPRVVVPAVTPGGRVTPGGAVTPGGRVWPGVTVVPGVVRFFLGTAKSKQNTLVKASRVCERKPTSFHLGAALQLQLGFNWLVFVARSEFHFD